MNEAEQLQILERIPGFTRPSAEWLSGLEVGDRVMVTFVANFERGDRSGEYEVCGRDGLLFAVRELGNWMQLLHLKGWCAGIDAGSGYWISPIEPEPPRQGAPAEEDDEDDWLTGAVKAATKFKSDLHQIAAQLGIPTDDQMMGAIGRRLSDLLGAEQWFQMYSGLVQHGDIQDVGNRAKSLAKIANRIGIDGLSNVNDLEGAIGQRLTELLETEELYQAALPVPYGDRS